MSKVFFVDWQWKHHLNIDPEIKLPTRMTRMSQRPAYQEAENLVLRHPRRDGRRPLIDLNLSADSLAAFARPEAREDIPYIVRLSSTIAWTRSALTRNQSTKTLNTYEEYGITPSYKTGHISENAYPNLKRKASSQHRVLAVEDQKIERYNEKLLKSLDTLAKAEQASDAKQQELAEEQWPEGKGILPQQCFCCTQRQRQRHCSSSLR
ncbi:hypothetical protein B0H14DRAFT_3485230 [Mycena olivaceomarginata]|nr:hypothetical protein B0H14DRAFT_3485230 [Mycena olivaceomarginata]